MKNLKINKIYLLILFLFSNITVFSEELTFETIEVLYDGMLENGMDKLGIPLLVALSMLTVIQIIRISLENLHIRSLSQIMPKLLNVMISFSLYGYIINNAKTVINMLYGLFVGIGSYFTKTKVTNVDDIWNTGLESTSNLWKVTNEWANYVKQNPIIVSLNIDKYTIDTIKVISIILVIFFIYIVYAILVTFILFVTIQFKLGIALTLPFTTGATNDFTKEYVGNKFITTVMLGGLQLTVTTVLASLFKEIMEKAKFNQEITIREIKIESIFLFLCVGILLSILVLRINKIISKLSN